MSIKDLFDKGHSLKFVKNKTKEDLAESVESYRYIDAYNERKDLFRPDVDFATASNFARFGLAEEYYDTAIKRIYETYPYDGSQAEKVEWENESTYLDLFIFENEYPRSNGYVLMGMTSSFTGTPTSNVLLSTTPQYIFLKGGPHPDSGGDYKSDFSAGPSKKGVSKANIYDTTYQRTNNLELDLDKGVTVETWMKKEGWASTGATAHHEYIFHSWNSGSFPSSGSLRAYVYGSTPDSKGLVHLRIASGSTELRFDHDTGLSTIADSEWHHYALTVKTNGSDTVSNLYVDGKHASLSSSATTINEVTGTMIASIGGLVGPLPGAADVGKGWGNIISASFDEFRYWKAERDAQQIGRFYIDQVGGGTNTDNEKHDDRNNKVSLGVYYKFNEGKTGATSTDSTILDYSGRISNGNFVNYNTNCRNTGSAIVLSLSSSVTKEFLDPIIYSSHPEVSNLLTSKKSIGSMHDHENASSLYKSMPAWIAEQDESESKNLKFLTQIMASFFDDLYLQIEKLPRLKDINYPDDTSYEKPLPFAERLLSSRGYEVPELFADMSDLAKYLDRDEKKLFEKKLYEVKNIIYQNIYNNLSYIQKSKGTFKSLRNFLRCFGVDEELIKLNVYSNNDVYKLKDNTTNTSVKKSYIDFDDLETRLTSSVGTAGAAYTATAYQYHDSTDSNSISYIPAIADSAADVLVTGAMMTIETEVIFPKRSIVDDDNYKTFPSVSSSIFGLHAVAASNTDLSFADSGTIDFNVHVSKPDDDLRNVKFILSGSRRRGTPVFSPIETSDTYAGVYDNEKWNLAFRLRPTKAATDTRPQHSASVGFLLPVASAYTYELYGVNYASNILQNEFTVSGTMSLANAVTFFTQPKRIFLGAERTNFTGSVVKHSDVKISSTRVWLDYLSDEAIRAHARDPSSYGALQPYRNANDSLNTNFVPQISTLILNWTMDNLTGSNASGQFLIEDFASGSTNAGLKFGDSWASPISRYNYSGRGDKFVADAAHKDQAIDIEFVQSAKLKLPEVVNSDDMVKILSQQDEMVFTRDTNYIEHYLSVEKSMYQTISEEMLRLFATVSNFNNLIGEPVNRYRPSYKKIEKLRALFFESVENDSLDLEKFIEYFKWIDDAVAIMISQLIPLSSNNTEFLRNMVESHILERNKYCTKFPTLETKTPILEATATSVIKGDVSKMLAPVNPGQNSNQSQNSLWWKLRADRDDVLTSGNPAVDSNKADILKIIVTEVTASEPTLKTIDGQRYASSYFHNRAHNSLVNLSIEHTNNTRVASVQTDNNSHDFYKSTIKWASDDDFIYLDIDNEIKETDISDNFIPPELNKKKFRIRALTMTAEENFEATSSGIKDSSLKYTHAKTSLLLPFQIYTSSLSTGYQSLYSDQFKIDFTNVHEDKYGFNAAALLQGPFTETHVGGNQHRHIKLNRGSDTPLTRAEGWHLQEFLNLTSDEYVMKEDFANVSNTIRHEDPMLLPTSMVGSTLGDPSPYEYWRNGVGTDNPWSFIAGPTPTAGTGPSAAYDSGGFAYCEILPSRVGQTFGIVTPLIDLLDVSDDSQIRMSFRYHMFGLQVGNLKVQVSLDKAFETDVTDLLFNWSTLGSNSTAISGQQQAAATSAWGLAIASSDAAYGSSLSPFLGKRFYIRFLYTAGVTQLGDCAIDQIYIHKEANRESGGVYQNSFKLLSPTHDNHHRPRAVYTRDTIAKRPVNIRNIHTTASSPSEVGNFFNKYEVVSTVSPEANDPYFVKNNSQITQTTMRYLTTGSIQGLLSITPGTVRTSPAYSDYTLPNRSFLSGSVKNRTRITTRFSSPGGFETLSRGFLDPAHETHSPANALTYRNDWIRKVYNSQLQAHQGQYGVSTHRTFSSAPYSVIMVTDGNAANGMTEKEHITLTSTDGTIRRYVITNSASDGSTATGTVLVDGTTDTGAGTAGTAEDGGVAVSINLTPGSSSTQNAFLVAIKAAIEHANGHNGKIIVSAVPAEADGAQLISIYQNVAGTYGNIPITTDISQVYVDGFTGGTNRTARVYGSEAVGSITSGSYEISGDASKHKYHRNNLERLKYVGSGDINTDSIGFVTASMNDNAFISHMIPRTDQQTRWITASII